ncbi:MAG: ribosomal RNA small subunit methyltransferase A [Armatimonadota bacterium]|nr:MAG: ribosomal RNA small subunit methyltransferase A [Armatimonadota bacterium]
MAGRIVAASGLQPGESCLEIGAGLGMLTEALAAAGARVTAIEVDARLAQALSERMAGRANVSVVRCDFLKMDLGALLSSLGRPVRVVANIPYSITSPIIERLLEHRTAISGIALLVQKEVAERVSASPGSRQYGSLSVFCQMFTEARVAFAVPRHLFYPEPAVESVLLLMTPRETGLTAERESAALRLARAAFTQRRKRVVNPLSDLLGIPKDKVEDAIRRAGLDPARRAAELSVADLVRLAKLLLPSVSGPV